MHTGSVAEARPAHRCRAGARPAAGSRPRRRRRPPWRWSRPSGARSRRRRRASGTRSAPRPPRRSPPPARRRPSPRRRSGCTPRRGRPPAAAISRMASCSEGKSSVEGVDGDHRRHAVTAHDREMREQVGRTELDLLGVLRQHRRRKGRPAVDPVPAGMQLQRPHRGHHDRGVGHQARGPALDVEEALGAHVGAEAGLRDQVLTGVNPDQVGHHRRIAVGDVAERAGVDEHRRVLERLQQVRLDGITHDDGHGPGGLELLRRSPVRRPAV